MLRKDKKKKAKNLIFLKYFKEHKKISIALIACLCFLGCFLTINYGRYVKNIIEVYYLRTQNFYFSSDKLTINGKGYEIEPWGGTLDHSININMSSLLNSLKGTTVDIIYDVSCSTDGRVDCSIDTKGIYSKERTISAESNADNFVVIVSPKENVSLKDGDEVTVTVKAVSKVPYKEELSASFTLIIGNYGLNYEIEDEKGRVYFDSIITNTLDTNSAEVTLTITKPDDISFDMTNVVLDQTGVSYDTVQDEKGNQYIYKVTFTVGPKSSMMVRYFKSNVNADYSYVLSDESASPVVTFTPIIK